LIIMTRNTHSYPLEGIVFAAGGAFTLVGSALHPTGGSSNYHDSFAAQLANPIGAPANWLTLIGSLLLAWGVWMLLDSAWRNAPGLVRAGARLAIVSSAILVIESGASLAMRTTAAAYAAGTPVPMVRLSETLYPACLPALMLGALLLNLGNRRLAPAVVRIVGAVGMVALGLAGPFVDGLHIIALWPLYLGGVLTCIWIIWAGVHEAVGVASGTVAAQKVDA
jgi:hypothetical protein